MRNEQIVIGTLVAVLCLLGIWQSGWFLANTNKGKWLVRRFGEDRAPWVFRGLLALGFLLGVLLAANVIRPVQW